VKISDIREMNPLVFSALAMDKLQENMKLVAERIEKGTPPEAAPAYEAELPTVGTDDAGTYRQCHQDL